MSSVNTDENRSNWEKLPRYSRYRMQREIHLDQLVTYRQLQPLDNALQGNASKLEATQCQTSLLTPVTHHEYGLTQKRIHVASTDEINIHLNDTRNTICTMQNDTQSLRFVSCGRPLEITVAIRERVQINLEKSALKRSRATQIHPTRNGIFVGFISSKSGESIHNNINGSRNGSPSIQLLEFFFALVERLLEWQNCHARINLDMLRWVDLLLSSS
jgi:hypothetical protein